MSHNKSHHVDTVSASVVTGGSQAVAALFAFVRSKFAALWIGPEGVGVVGLLTQLQAMLVTGFDLGVSNSAVREVAISRANADTNAESRIRRALFRLTCWTGIACAVSVAAFSAPLSAWMFNVGGFALDVGFTAAAAAMLLFAGAHGTLMRGHGMVVPLAVQRIISGVAATLFALAGYYWIGQSAIGAVIVLSALASWIIASIQSRSLRGNEEAGASPGEVIELVKHGLPFVWSAFSFALVSYVVGVLVVDYSGLKAGGFYQAAWSLTGYLVGFVLSAMGQDFLPRLSAAIASPREAEAMINSQIEVGTLLALPGMFFFSAFAFGIFPLLFSPEFAGAAPIAQAALLGCLGRILNWPMLFALNAQRKSKLHVVAVTAASAAYLLFAWIGLRAFGAMGAVLGFVAMQAMHAVWLRVTLGRTLGFRFTGGAFSTVIVAVAALSVAPFLGRWPAALLFVAITASSMLRLSVLTGRLAWLRCLTGPLVRLTK